jgi:hypothetical protein
VDAQYARPKLVLLAQAVGREAGCLDCGAHGHQDDFCIVQLIFADAATAPTGRALQKLECRGQ